MKNSIKILAGSVAVLFALTATCPGQVTTVGKTIRSTGEKVVTGKSTESNQGSIKLDTHRTLRFSGESKSSEIKIDVTEEYNYLGVRIRCDMNTGGVSVELLDPSGKNQGNFSVKTDDGISMGDKTTTIGVTSGRLKKAFRYPAKGTWTIQVTPLSATGEMTIDFSRLFEPRIDMLENEQFDGLMQ